MVTAEILKPCTVTCQPGSVVEITEEQFRALGDAARYLPDDIGIEILETDTPETEAEVSETVENLVESVENAPKKKPTRKKG